MEQDTDYMNIRHIKNNTTAPSERKTGQETAGGRRSITSTHLGIACFIVLIISLAIAIGLRVQVLQMDKNMTGLNGKIQNMSETLDKTLRNLRSVCTVLRNCSESLCPSGWKVHNHHCYKLSTESKDWDSAKLQCESEHSHLIIINTEQEQEEPPAAPPVVGGGNDSVTVDIGKPHYKSRQESDKMLQDRSPAFF
ncbi:uncharacterized protein LOC144675355 [Cetorhinus maximus]